MGARRGEDRKAACKVTQSAEVLHLLRASGLNGVTQQDAIRLLSCYRLAARIADLRADGYPITSEMVSRDGEIGRAHV